MTIVDLNREKRIRQLLRDLKDHLTLHPELVTRTTAYLEGGNPVANSEKQIVCRLSADLLNRIMWLEKQLKQQPVISNIGPVTRSSVIRLALVHGLYRLETDLQRGFINGI